MRFLDLSEETKFLVHWSLDGNTDEVKLPVSRATNKYISILFARTQVHVVVPSLEIISGLFNRSTHPIY